MSHRPNTVSNSGSPESQAPIARNSLSIFSASAYQSVNDMQVLEFLLKTANSTAELTEHTTSVRVADINDSLNQGFIAAQKNEEQLVSQAMQMRVGAVGSMAQGATSGFTFVKQVKEINYANNMEKFANKVNAFEFKEPASPTPLVVGNAGGAASGIVNPGEAISAPAAGVVGRYVPPETETDSFNTTKATLMDAKKLKNSGLTKDDWDGILGRSNERNSTGDPLGLDVPIQPGSTVTFKNLLESATTKSELDQIKTGVNRGKQAADEYLKQKIRVLDGLSNTITSSLKGVGDIASAQLKADIEAKAAQAQAEAQAIAQLDNNAMQLTQETIGSMSKVSDSMGSGAQQLLQTFGQTWGIDTQPLQG